MPTARSAATVLSFALLVSAASTAQQPPAAGISDVEVNQRVESLLQQMTLQEKIGQITQLGPGPIGPENLQPEDLIRQGRAGSVLWTIDSAQIKRMQEIAVKESRLKIPLLFGFDVIHGFKNVFPVPIGAASSWDPAMVERAQAMAAHEASVSGINWTFGPMVDIARDPRWGRIVEGAGEDPYLGAAMARAQVLGFQGPRLGTPDRVLASVKHFAGYGAAEGGRDYDACYIPEELFRNVYLRPFQAAVDAGVGTVMSAYMDLNDVPASGNKWLLEDVLRRDMGFRGFVISDAWAVASLAVHGYARDPEDAAFRGLTAGVNMDMGSETYLRHVAKLVESGRLPIAVLDRMVSEILAVKVRLGVFEHPYGDLAIKEKVLNDPEHRAATRVAAQRSMVLLRNEGGALPLKKTLASIAVIGPIADSTEEIKGSWTAEWSQGVSVLEGLRNKLPNARIEFVRGGDMQRLFPLPWDADQGKKATPLMPEAEMKKEVAKAVEAAKGAEAVVLVLGERAAMSGEAASRASLALPGNQQELLEAVVATGKPVVLVLLNGRPLEIGWAAEHVPAILEAWYPGTEGGNAIADVLVGDVNPGGKLPVSWPRVTGQVPAYYNHNLTHSPEDAPGFTSRYADLASTPLYPFGYGLSYTTFVFSNLKLDQQSISASGTLQVWVDVENRGAVAGDEVVQLYIHQRAGSASRPVRELKGFERIALAPAEKKTVHFSLGKDGLKFWSPQAGTWVVEPEQFDVWVGGDSKAPLHAEFRVQ
ncbi:MAG TPA: beta-glucosidase BglX [Bryobacteraceae bacterium]|nr:beta-glucosidase BglX [Bryobacteraceae bacterium]